jgi:hypothetical protein
VKRWLVALLGIALAAAAFLAVATVRRPARLAPHAPPPRAEIDDASRAQLERVIRDAEREEQHSK